MHRATGTRPGSCGCWIRVRCMEETMSTSRFIPRSHVLLLLALFTLALLLAVVPATAHVPRATAPDFAAIDAYVESERQAMHVPGLALGIVQGDRIVHLKGFGQT